MYRTVFRPFSTDAELANKLQWAFVSVADLDGAVCNDGFDQTFTLPATIVWKCIRPFCGWTAVIWRRHARRPLTTTVRNSKNRGTVRWNRSQAAIRSMCSTASTRSGSRAAKKTAFSNYWQISSVTVPMNS